jgi:hypothetical protein
MSPCGLRSNTTWHNAWQPMPTGGAAGRPAQGHAALSELDAGAALPAPDRRSYPCSRHGASTEFINQARLFPAGSTFAQQADRDQPLYLALTGDGMPDNSPPMPPRCTPRACVADALPVRLGARARSACFSPAARVRDCAIDQQTLEALGSYFGRPCNALSTGGNPPLQQNLSGIFDT